MSTTLAPAPRPASVDSIAPPWAREVFAAQVAWNVGVAGRTGGALVGHATHDTLHGTWCLTKPLAGVAVAALHERGLLDLDERLDSIAGISLRTWRPTVAELLAHEFDLRAPGLALARSLRPAERVAAVAAACVDPPRRGAYSEYVPWQLLSWHVEERLGQRLSRLIRSIVLEPLGIEGAVLFPDTPEEVIGAADRIAPMYTGFGGGHAPIALVHDRAPFIPSADPAVFGGLTSAEGMVAFGAAVLRAVQGDSAAGDPPMDELTVRLASADLDGARFCLGFSRCLPSRYGTGVIGHLGWSNSSALVIDVRRSRVFSCVANTASLDAIEQTIALAELQAIALAGVAS